MILPSMIGVILLTLGLAARRGPRVALWAAWSLSLLAPSWVKTILPGMATSILTVATAVALACFVAVPFSKTLRRWLLCDTLIVLLVVSQLATLLYTDSFRASTVMGIISQWFVPYLAGRFAIASREDLDGLAKWMAISIVVISTLVVIESVTHVNVINSYFGRGGEPTLRFGIARASGPTTHPIYLGMFVSLLMPWAVWCWSLARRGEASRWLLALPVFCSLGVFASASRGPVLALLGTLACLVFFHFRRKRAVIGTAFVVLVISAIIGNQFVLEGARDLEHGRDGQTRQKMILIDGEYYEYDGTLHRLLLFKVYGDAMWKGGLLGHGPSNGASFLDLVDGKVSKEMESIDNHYVVFTLKYGFLGTGIFILTALCGIGYSLKSAYSASPPSHLFVAAQAGSLAMVSALLLTVWFPNDFRVVWLFSLGCAAAWRVHQIGDPSPMQVSSPTEVRNVPVRRLVPGHPEAARPAE
jgi:hypothetical protein